MSSNNLFDIYRSMAAMARLVVEEDGSVKSLSATGTKKTHFVKGKPLKLPLQSVLNDDNVRDYAILHPFGESIAKGESEVLEDLRKRSASTIGMCVLNMLNQFAVLCSEDRQSGPLDPLQAKVLSVGKDIDEKVAKSIMQITAAILTSTNTAPIWPVKIFLARNGATSREEETRHYSRWANISFPLYAALIEEINNKPDKGNGRKFVGVTTNEKTLRAIVALLEYIFPHIDKEAYYSQGSDSEIAPFAHAFLKGMQVLTLQVNEVLSLFENHTGFRDQQLPTDWMAAIDELEELYYEINKIPVHNSITAQARQDKLAQDPNRTEMGVPMAQPSQQVISPQQMHQQNAEPEPEYIMGPNGMRRNPKYYGSLRSGAWGMMPVINPYDPRGDGQIVVPSGATPVIQSAGAGWGGSAWN